MAHRSEEILESLGQDCPCFGGAVLASPDGLVMAATPQLRADLPAACAAALVLQADACLAMLAASQQVAELMLWTSGGLWFAARLSHNHVLLICATDAHQAGAVRLAAQLAVQELNAVLG